MESRYFGKKSFHYSTLSSSNAKAKELLHEAEIMEGTLIRTDEQVAGRGYASNIWESQAHKNITASYILKPSFLSPDKQFWITKVLSLGVKETVSFFLPLTKKVTIKWPNDIYVGEKKIAGILVENSLLSNTITQSIAGIGLNVNQQQFFTKAPNPTSIKIESNKEADIDYCFQILSFHLEKWYNLLKSESYEIIENEYLDNLFRYKMPASFMVDKKKFEATIVGIDPHGRLKLQLPHGAISYYDFKEVRFIL